MIRSPTGRGIVAGLLVCATLRARAETGQAVVLTGRVLQNESGGVPLPNVSVRVPGEANDTASDGAGDFRLEFRPGRGPGDRIQIQVERLGWVVVNDWELRLNLPSKQDLLVVLMCKEPEREQWRLRHLRQAPGPTKRMESNHRRNQEIEARLKNIEATLVDSRALDGKMLDSLWHERDQLRRDREQLRLSSDRLAALTEELATRLATPQPEQRSEAQDEALRLFVAGKLEEVEELLKPRVPGTVWLGAALFGEGGLGGRRPYGAGSLGLAASVLLERDPDPGPGATRAWGIRLTGGWKWAEFRTPHLSPDGQLLFVVWPTEQGPFLEVGPEFVFRRSSTIRPAVGAGARLWRWRSGCWSSVECWAVGIPLHGRLAWTFSGRHTLVADLFVGLERGPVPSVQFTGFGAGVASRDKAWAGVAGLSVGVER